MVTPGTLRRLVAIPVVAVAGLLVACQPPPAPDGRDLGVTVTDLPDHQTPGTSLDISATVTRRSTRWPDAPAGLPPPPTLRTWRRR